MATLTYDYPDSTVVLGPLATVSEPNAYDLCDEHAHTLTAPRGWQIVRLATNFEPAPPSGDDLLALVDAVRRAADAAPRIETAPRMDSRAGRADAAPPEPELGPFASATPTAPDTSSPLDPKSAYARRRAQFTVMLTQIGRASCRERV
mgnify:CR=1 FL=1